MTPSSKKSSNMGSGNPFWRKWGWEDEIVVLKEMCEIRKPDGKVDGISLYNGLKGKLHGNYSIEQLKNTMKNMRTKYGMCVKGGDLADLDSHEAVVFGLSEKMWGNVVMRKNRVRNTVANENGVDGKRVSVKNVVSVDNGVRKTVANENGVGGKKCGRKNVVSDDNGVRKAVANENGVGGKKCGRKNILSVDNGVCKAVANENGVGGKKNGVKNLGSVDNGVRKTVVIENVDDGKKDCMDVIIYEKEEVEEERNFARK